MEVALHLTVAGGINVTTSYWVENLNLSFSVQKYVWISMVPECLSEMDWKNFEKKEKIAEKYLRKSSIFRNVTGCNNLSNLLDTSTIALVCIFSSNFSHS